MRTDYIFYNSNTLTIFLLLVDNEKKENENLLSHYFYGDEYVMNRKYALFI